jgi:hypothetical protein
MVSFSRTELFEGYTRMVARKKPAPQTKPNFERERSNAPIIQVSGCPGCEDPGFDNKERRPVPAKPVSVEPHVGSRQPYLDYESPWNAGMTFMSRCAGRRMTLSVRTFVDHLSTQTNACIAAGR